MIAELLAALHAEFDGEISVVESVPSKFSAPSIVIAPGDPFLTPGTHSTVEETWEILVVFNPTGAGRNVEFFRSTSLRVRKAAGAAGALWVQTRAPRRASPNPDDPAAIAPNTVRFKYQPETT